MFPATRLFNTTILVSLACLAVGESGCGGALPFASQPQSQLSAQNSVVAAATSNLATAPAPNQPGATCAADTQIVISRPARPQRSMPLVFWANPSSITKGQSTNLSWTSSNTTSVTIDHNVGTLGPSGTVTVSPVVTTTYMATAMGPGGSVSQAVTVAVDMTGLSPAITAAASPQAITKGQPTTLSWTSTNSTYVTIDHGIGQVAASGSIPVSPSASTIYTITAGCAGASAAQQVAVNVQNAKDGITALNHIIFMLQENRSFDSYFGKLNDYRTSLGLPAEVDGLPSGAMNYQNDGTTAVPAFKMQSQCIEELTASWNESHWDFNLKNPTSTTPKMDGYVATAQGYAAYIGATDTAGHRAMGYYDSSDLPYYYFMATQFATSDRWFSPISSMSAPNRLYAFAATSAGFTKYATHTLATKTIFQALQDAGISWKIYYSDTYPNGQPITGLDTFYDFASQHRDRIVPVNPNYFNDLQNGTLPQVAFIEHGSASGRDEHPGGSNIQVGAKYVSSLINGLMSSSSWKDSAFVLSYDEAGGLYDHVPPVTGIVSPDGIQPTDLDASDIQDDFTRTGFRVPMIVVSPFTIKHLVSHNPMDYTAILKLIETRFNIASLTARDAAQPDMTEFFDFVNPPWLTPPTPPVQPVDKPCYLDHLP
ncbi:MAG: Phospholipase [Acidobacteriales bacterium]|nr:Phospholipase [Terriglobales bacterium]